MSGGIDSSVCAALSVDALGPDTRVRPDAAGARFLGRPAPRAASCSPSTSASSTRCTTSRRRSRRSAATQQRDEAIRQRVPGIRRRLEAQDRDRRAAPRDAQPLQARRAVADGRDDPSSACRTAQYLQIVAATNYKQRIRKTVEYFHADRLNYAWSARRIGSNTTRASS